MKIIRFALICECFKCLLSNTKILVSRNPTRLQNSLLLIFSNGHFIFLKVLTKNIRDEQFGRFYYEHPLVTLAIGSKINVRTEFTFRGYWLEECILLSTVHCV